MIYRLDDLIESHDFEHDQKFVKAEHWKEACDEANENRKSVIFLQEQNKKLRECVEYLVKNGIDSKIATMIDEID